MPGETIWCHFVLILASQLFHRWYYYHHESILDWLFFQVHPWNQIYCIKQGVSNSHLPQFSSCQDVSPQFSSVKAGRQQMWVRWQEFCLGCSWSTLAELSSSSLLNYIASQENLPFRCCVAVPVRHFDQQCLQ
jgi:hypothetical protein